MSDDFLNIAKEEVKKNLTPQKEVIERTLHTIHTLRIYPNGEVYLKKSLSWFDKKGQVIKKKEKKEPIKMKEAVLGQEEIY